MYGKGISVIGDILDLAVLGNIVEKMGAWFSYGDLKIGQGRENAKQYLENNPDTLSEITKKVKEFMGLDEDSNDKKTKKD